MGGDWAESIRSSPLASSSLYFPGPDLGLVTNPLPVFALEHCASPTGCRRERGDLVKAADPVSTALQPLAPGGSSGLPSPLSAAVCPCS